MESVVRGWEHSWEPSKVQQLGQHVLPLLDDLSLGQFLSFLSSNQSSQLGAEVEWTGFVRHL